MIDSTGVRGTVRDLNSDKAAWIQPYFDERYGEASFEITQAKDLSVPNCLDEAADGMYDWESCPLHEWLVCQIEAYSADVTTFAGCSGVVHVASVVTFDPDPNNVIPQSESFVENAFEAAMKVKSIQRFVFTSSSTAATQSKFNEVYDLTDQSWNDEAVTKAWASPPYTQDRMMDVYAASKVQSEQKLWKLVKERKPHFVVNTVLPDFLAGLPVNMDKQGLVTSNGALKWMWDGQDGWQMLYPQFMIDARDCALLHVAALVHPHLESERVFGYAHNKTWTDWIARLKRMYPEHAFPGVYFRVGRCVQEIALDEADRET